MSLAFILGSALRQYARTEPGSVQAFMPVNTEVLSPLSQREAAKPLNRVERS